MVVYTITYIADAYEEYPMAHCSTYDIAERVRKELATETKQDIYRYRIDVLDVINK